MNMSPFRLSPTLLCVAFQGIHSSNNYLMIPPSSSVSWLIMCNPPLCPAGLLVSSIRLTKTSLPSHAILGEDVVLECSYDMEGDKLYSVKWYRNGKVC